MNGVAATFGWVLPASAQFGMGEGSCTHIIGLTSLLIPGIPVSGMLAIDIGDDHAIETRST